MTDVSFAAVRPLRAAGIVYALVVAAAGRGGSARKPAAAGVAAPDTVPPPDTVNLYAAAGANALSSVAARARPLVYVPNSHDGSVTVIDPRRYRVVRTFPTGDLPQHVVPSYDLTTLWVANNRGNSLTPIDPVTGREGTRVPVADPYNLYFAPDGRLAIVVAERRRELDFRDATTMALVQSLPLPCKGVDHTGFIRAATGASCTSRIAAGTRRLADVTGPGPSACWIRGRDAWWRRGRFPVAAAPTWGT